MNAIEIKNVSKKYCFAYERPVLLKTLFARPKKEEVWALRGIDLKIDVGQTVGIIGQNGSGKSTLLKILTGITYPNRGNVKINGRVSSLIELGTGFHADLTGKENIYLNGMILGLTKNQISRRMDEIISFADIGEYIDAPVGKYSSGMFVRLGFAVAVHLDPDIILLDEVLAVGDAGFQKKCFEKIADFKKMGRTILLVSHNLKQVANVCSRAICLERGIIKFDGGCSEVISAYLDGFGSAADSGDQGTVFSRQWPDRTAAPQNRSTIIRKISICDDAGRQLSGLKTDENFFIEIEFEVKPGGAFVGTTVIIYDNEYNCVLSSISNNEKEWYGKHFPAGIYKNICAIPANFLNNGVYIIKANIFDKRFSDVFSIENALQLRVDDGIGIRNDFNGEFGGVIRPFFDWRTKKIR